MHARPGLIRTLTLPALVAGGLAVAVPATTWGDPPPWAPAHGKRKQGDPYTGYSGKKWNTHYGVVNGRCNREAVGAAIGVGLSYGAAAALKQAFPTITILITWDWLLRATLLAFLAGVLGAIYPAWLAARQDAIVALAYE